MFLAKFIWVDFYRLPRQFHPKGTLLYGFGSRSNATCRASQRTTRRGFSYRIPSIKNLSHINMIKRSRETHRTTSFPQYNLHTGFPFGNPDGLTQERKITLQASRYKRLQSNGFITRWWMNYYYYYYFLGLLLAGLLLEAGFLLFWLLLFF